MDAKPAADPPKPDEKGLACHKCGCRHLFVVWTRQGPGKRVRRRRKCRHCGTLVYTDEKTLGGG